MGSITQNITCKQKIKKASNIPHKVKNSKWKGTMANMNEIIPWHIIWNNICYRKINAKSHIYQSFTYITWMMMGNRDERSLIFLTLHLLWLQRVLLHICSFANHGNIQDQLGPDSANSTATYEDVAWQFRLMESVVYFATCGKPLLELLWLWLRGGQTMGFGPHLACQITYTFFQATCFWLWTVVQCCCIANCTVSSLPVVRQSRIQSSSQKFHHLCFSWHIGWSCHMLVLFQSQTKMFLKWLKKIKPFQSECLKIQANEHCYGNQQVLIQQWDEWPKCLSKKWLKCLSEKNTHMTCSVCMTWHPHQLSPTCMDECYHGFSVGKLLAVSCLCCLNYKPSC